MNPEKELVSAGRSPFWVCLVVFMALAFSGALQLRELIRQNQQTRELVRAQGRNSPQLNEAMQKTAQIEARLRPFTVELIAIARTNAVAQQIVNDFDIKWTPGTNSPAGQAGKQ